MKEKIWKFFESTLGIIGYAMIVALIFGAITLFFLFLSQFFNELIEKLGIWIYAIFLIIGAIVKSIHNKIYEREN